MREVRFKPAGLRTHVLVGLSTLIDEFVRFLSYYTLFYGWITGYLVVLYGIDEDAAVVYKADWSELYGREKFTKRNAAKRTCNLDLFSDVYKNGKLLERYHEFGEVAMTFNSEVTKLLEESGLNVESIYGDLNRIQYRADSSRIVLVAKRKQWLEPCSFLVTAPVRVC